ncbi:MAG: type II toxin-antitoxin system VapC family toxin [Deltaproteobacteria bacterium]|nr:type II toxin-antitoxin system VapC family toxin [Deltaproteobacteria bacterium]
MPPLIVLDASVVLTLLLNEPAAADVAALLHLFVRGRITCLVPALLSYEIANALQQKSVSRSDGVIATTLYAQWMAFRIPQRDPQPQETAMAFRILGTTRRQTYYDAVYHAMAIVQQGTLLTADRRYARAASTHGHLLTLDTVPPLIRRWQK